MKPLKKFFEEKENLLRMWVGIMSSMMFDDCFQVFLSQLVCMKLCFCSPHAIPDEYHDEKREAETLPVPNLFVHPIVCIHIAVFFLTPFIVYVRARQLKNKFSTSHRMCMKCRRWFSFLMTTVGIGWWSNFFFNNRRYRGRKINIWKMCTTNHIDVRSIFCV